MVIWSCRLGLKPPALFVEEPLMEILVGGLESSGGAMVMGCEHLSLCDGVKNRMWLCLIVVFADIRGVVWFLW